MKKVLFFAAIAFFGLSAIQAQDGGQTSQGNILIEANTNFGAAHEANTSITFFSIDGESVYNIGLEGGYFVIENLALKLGLGYGGTSSDGDRSVFSYKVGAKYYVLGMIPIQIDYTGASIEDLEFEGITIESENPSFVGLQAGYAVFLGDNVALEPGVKYNLTMNEDAFSENIFELNVGFSLFF